MNLKYQQLIFSFAKLIILFQYLLLNIEINEDNNIRKAK